MSVALISVIMTAINCGSNKYDHLLHVHQPRMMLIKHYAPNRCLCIKVAKSTMCNRSLGCGLQRCHNYKIAVSCVQRMKVIVKMKKEGEEVRGKG